MNFRDITALAWRNLKQAKLRTALTVIGVIVGIAAIVTMVSFGLGLQNNLLKEAFVRIDFFTSITVFGPSTDIMLAIRDGSAESEPDEAQSTPSPEPSTAPGPSPTPVQVGNRILDDAVIEELKHLAGVRYVLPLFNTFNYIQFEGRTRRTSVGGAPLNVEYNPRFKTFLAGRHLSSESAHEAVIAERLVTRLKSKQPPRFDRSGRDRSDGPSGPFRPASTRSDEDRKREAETVIGKELTILTLPDATVSAGSVFGIPIFGTASNPESDELADEPYSKFEKHVYKIVGVLKSEEGIDINFASSASIYIPLEQAKQFREANRSPLEQMGEMLTGDNGYQSAEVRVSDLGQLDNVKKEIKKRGFNFWNIGNQIEEIKRVFLIVNASLALIGGLALLVASFGISNTMIMSIRERTREIGIMKAIGGTDGEIMRIFFVEASLIGLFGGVLGVICGWGIDRIANTIANRWVVRQAGQAMRHIEFFSIPWYLSFGAILFAVTISLIAAIYPAMRAARVDPIKALRYE